MYVAPRTRFDKVSGIDNSPCHLVLLCENQTGYQNLIKMVSRSYTEGFYFKPRIDHELLRASTRKASSPCQLVWQARFRAR